MVFAGAAIALAALFFVAHQSDIQLTAWEMERATELGAAIGVAVGMM